MEFRNAQDNSLLYTLEDNKILSRNIDPIAIGSVTFTQIEARNCKITIFDDDWLHSVCITDPDIILQTDIINVVMVFTHNGIENKFYINPKSCSYNSETRKLVIGGIDLVGVLQDVGKDKNNFVISESYIDQLENVLSILNGIVDYSYNIDTNTPSYSVEDFVTHLPQQQTLGVEPFYEHEIINQWEYYKRLEWAYMGELDIGGAMETSLAIVRIEYHVIFAPDPGGFYDYFEDIQVTHLRVYFPSDDIEMIVDADQYYEDSTSSGSFDGLWDQQIDYFWMLYHAHGFTGDENFQTQLEYTAGNGNYYLYNMGLLYFTGGIFLDNIELKPTEPGSELLYTSYNKLLKILLLYNNYYLYAEGNTLILGRKQFSGEGIDISDNVMSSVISYVGKSEFDIDELYDNIAAGSYQHFIEEYYNDLANSAIQRIKCNIENKQDLNILDRIKIQDVNYTVASINLDNYSFIYDIEGWAI